MDEDWRITPVTDRSKDKAWSQLGTSGSGNHFVEIGLLELDSAELGLDAEEFGDAFAFLCAAQSGYLSGQNLQLDGGSYEGVF